MDRGPGWSPGSGGFNEGFGRPPPPGLPPAGPRPPLLETLNSKDRGMGRGPPPGVPPPKPPEGPPPPAAGRGGPWAGRGDKGAGMMGDMDSRPMMMEGPMGRGGPMGMMGMMGPGMMGGIGGLGMGLGMGMPGGMMGPGMMGRGMMSGPMGSAGFGMGMGGPGMMGMAGGGMGLGFGFDGPTGGIMGGEGRGRGSGANAGKGGRLAGGGGRFGGRGSLATGPSRGEANDYCQHFVDTGQRPQNFLRDSHLTDRYEEYPKLKELVARKDALVAARATPPYYLKADLKELPLTPDTFGTKFDVVLIDPPWEEYARRAPGFGVLESWTWQEIMALEIEKITDPPAFVFLWCGSAEGLDAGRHCLKKWGFRRCEDICWIKTNKDSTRKASAVRQDANSVLQHTKEHCLMGIKGTVRRANDGHIIHANVDTDIIVSEEPPLGSTEKPEEMYHVVEHFCLGRRRLELFGEDRNVRPGWVTVGKSLSASNFNPQTYASHFRLPDGSPYSGSYTRPPPGAPHLLGTTEEIEMLRPRTPPPGG